MNKFDTFGALSSPYDVLMERGSFARRDDLIVHTTLDRPLSDRVFIDGLPVTSPARTVIDIAPFHPAKRLTTSIDGAPHDRLVTEEPRLTGIAQPRSQGRYWIPKLLGVIEGRRLRLCQKSAWPTPGRSPTVCTQTGQRTLRR